VPPGTLTSSASTGATLPGSQSAYRVTVRMDDGTYQAVDQDNRGFMVGDRVSFAADGNLTKQ
jgi:outer membrane lipoprotein SlyB